MCRFKIGLKFIKLTYTELGLFVSVYSWHQTEKNFVAWILIQCISFLQFFEKATLNVYTFKVNS